MPQTKGRSSVINHTVESLRAFEADIANEFNAGRIRAPIHLSGGNEQQLIDIFHDVNHQLYNFFDNMEKKRV